MRALRIVILSGFLALGLSSLGWADAGYAVNIAAVNGTASQSSTEFAPPTGVASLAIDGNTDGNFFDGSVSHTDNDLNAWWKVTFPFSGAFSGIRIWNRTDCCGVRLSNFTVTIFYGDSTVWNNSYFTSGGYPGDGSNPNPLTIDLSSNPQTGDSVEIQLNGQDYLSLAEVQVFDNTGSLPPIPTNPVPEPSSLALLAASLPGIGAIRGRFRR